MFQWQALEKEEFDSAVSQWGTDALNRDGYRDDKLLLALLANGTGNGTRPGVTTLPMGKNCSWVCWCHPSSPNCWGATLWFGYVTKNRSVHSKRAPHLRMLSSAAGRPTRVSYSSQYITSRAPRTSVETTSAAATLTT